MRIRFTEGVIHETEGRGRGPRYGAGEVYDLDDDQARRWLRRGVAVPAEGKDTTWPKPSPQEPLGSQGPKPRHDPAPQSGPPPQQGPQEHMEIMQDQPLGTKVVIGPGGVQEQPRPEPPVQGKQGQPPPQGGDQPQVLEQQAQAAADPAKGGDQEAEAKDDDAPAYRLQHAGGGRWHVVSAAGENMTDAALPKEDAQKRLAKLLRGK